MGKSIGVMPLRLSVYGLLALLLLSPVAEARTRSLLQEESFTDEVIDAAALQKTPPSLEELAKAVSPTADETITAEVDPVLPEEAVAVSAEAQPSEVLDAALAPGPSSLSEVALGPSASVSAEKV